MATFEYHGWTLDETMLLFEADGEQVQLRPTTLLISLDETGSSDLRDPNYPVFGIGGCAILVGQYRYTIGDPWLTLKEKHFGGASKPLHAADLRDPSSGQLEALGRFFRERTFFRMAAVLTEQTTINDGVSRLAVVTAALINRIAAILQRVPCSDIMLLFESAYSHGDLVWRTFEDMRLSRSIDGVATEIPIRMMHCGKELRLPSLEVADFVVQAAGAAVRGSLVGKPFLARKDFEAVFRTTPPEWAEFIRLDDFGLRKREA